MHQVVGDSPRAGALQVIRNILGQLRESSRLDSIMANRNSQWISTLACVCVCVYLHETATHTKQN